jgi:hypothetical protein
LPSRRIPEAARQSPACDIKKEQGTKPCSSHIEILIPDFYSRYVRSGGVFSRRGLASLPRLGPQLGAGLERRTLQSHGYIAVLSPRFRQRSITIGTSSMIGAPLTVFGGALRDPDAGCLFFSPTAFRVSSSGRLTIDLAGRIGENIAHK